MFSLQRWDILSPGDIGIQRVFTLRMFVVFVLTWKGLSWWIGKNPKDKTSHNKSKASKYLTEAEMLVATEDWRPYR